MGCWCSCSNELIELIQALISFWNNCPPLSIMGFFLKFLEKCVDKNGIYIVTGAAGFIGSACIRELNNRNIKRLLLVDDIEKTDKWKNLLGKSFEDFISKHALFDWVKDHWSQVRGILHLGACSDTLEGDGDYLMENNYRYTQRLCKASVEAKIPFVYASSAATYGDGSRGFSDDLDLLETLQPMNLYGFSKHFFDLWAKKEGLFDQIVGLKYFNVFGPNEQHKGRMASMVYKMFPKVREEGTVQLFKSSEPNRFEDGEQCRDFIYVKDVARITVDFLFNNIRGIFNIGRGKPTTWNELAGALFGALKKETNIDYIEMPQGLMSQYQNYTCADMANCLKAHGGSIKMMGIEEAVADYVQEHLLKETNW